MSVKLRLRRMGRKKLPIWGLVAADSRSPRDGRFIEDLGRYEPVQEPAVVKINHERVVYWLLEGAQPSDTVRNLLQRDGVLLRAAMTRKGAEAEAIEQAVAEFKERQAARDEKKNAKPTTSERRQKALEAERESAKERAAELAKERAEKEAELERLRKDTEDKERAEKEAQLAAAAAEAKENMGDADGAGESAGDAPAAATADGDTTVESVQGDMSNADTGNAAPITDAPPEEAAAEKAADLEAMDASGADAVQAEAQDAVEEAKEETSDASDDAAAGDSGAETVKAQADAVEEAPVADAAADSDAGDVSEEAPDAAEEQPAVEESSTEDVADDAGEAVAEQADAGAKEEAEAPKAKAKKSSGDKGDKLTDLWGIGPKYAGILTDAGVTSFSDIASKSVEELQSIITDAGSTTAGNEETWARQAELLAAGDQEAFDAYVTEMKNA